MSDEMESVTERHSWRTRASGLPVEVTNFNKDQPHYKGYGQFCYYVWICEPDWPVVFEQFWLPDKRVKYFETSPERITHDYEDLPWIHDIGWHGGITYYAKHGHTTGHRSVEIGCDYAHLWDMERGYAYLWTEIMVHAKGTAKRLAAVLQALRDGTPMPDKDEP